ncbi:MAG TPA: DUF1800 domain-containing protein, partial [Vicinamibacterales bacterium]|nr:DUF1800 domain-containing protein [Vicinamibacterales bacterium]
LFWHNHFATAYTKIAGIVGVDQAARYMAAKPSEDPGGVRGQIEMLRDHALDNFQNILLNIARDTAMLYWLDGRNNTRNKPQENFGREIMELFTMGVGHYTEPDVYAAARVFTGWNLTQRGNSADGSLHVEFAYLANQHETSAKTFSFPIYGDGSRTIPARSAAQGMQDGLDLIAALVANPNTGRYLATKLFRFFVSESGEVSEVFVSRVARTYFQSRYDMRAVMAEVLRSPEFWDERAYFSRFSWPAEFVARSLKEVGWRGFSANDALNPLSAMGQVLYDPPDVAGWDLGRSWFSTGSMLSRMNFAASLTANQRFKLLPALKPYASSPEALLSRTLELLTPAPLQSAVRADLLQYLEANGPWTGSDKQLEAKVPALMHLLVGSAEYQLV